ncbi:UNVERIFIED_CONTAM: putative general negative regulator of transcription C16 [Sesamum angustifolium]|uniref:General negative regulator of transcription C16 n=1 Tax=Sesamum angustifolium TaxID=2727405 RepID=A0AAW2LEL7_9LAMI
MSNEEEKRCPLCAEEMDWTDQQFMPCKCGYQVCVWCWHHIIDMAEKDETEGRCPACRAIYDKEKIVAMQSNCQRTMTKSSIRKAKPPKGKPKANEVKKDLTNVRVIQRKMAYVIGLPLSLADEDVLLRKEYFGQYGKVTKVSLSRTSGGAVQQFINDTCSVYVTYCKEEEALRCIQSVHGFVFEGRLLRASFGTAKYCHAWLKNMPCNNPACFILHSIGADEDSFGKDEVAAVHTRSRVQQIVGATDNVVKRSGNVLPPPLSDIQNSTSTTDRSTVRSGISDAIDVSENSTWDTSCPHFFKPKQGAIAVPHKLATFVDIVGRSNSAAPGKEGNSPEDRRILDLSSELSAATINGDIHAEEPYPVPNLLKVSSFSHMRNELFKSSPDEPLRGDSLLSNTQGSKDTCGSSHRTFFLHPSYPANLSEDSGGPALLHKKTRSENDFNLNQNLVDNRDIEASLPITYVNSMLNDSRQELKFPSTAKSDRIHRNSKSFSNEEIVERLQRIDDDNFTNVEENSASDAVESSIISNIMSIDFDSCEYSLAMTNALSEYLDETDGLGGSSWSSLNSDLSGYSFVIQDGFASQMPRSILPDYGDNKEQYLCKPQYPVSRPQSWAPPGISMPSRDPPPGFPSSERTTRLPRVSSGQQQSYGFKTPGFEMRPTGTPGLSALDDESRFWIMMSQSTAAHPNSKFSKMFASQNLLMQQELSHSSHMGNGLSGVDDIYGLHPRLFDQHQNYDPSFFTPTSKQKYVNGHISSTNGYHHGLGEVPRKGEVGMTELQRNERLGGVNKYFPSYGELMFSSADVYSRVFRL